MTKYFYVATEFAKVKINYVATKCFYVATEFGQGQEFLCRDRVFLCRDRVFLCCHKVWLWMGFMSRLSLGQGLREFTLQHRVLCRDKGARHCVPAKLRARGRHTLSRQCGDVLCRNREGHARATDQARPARARQTRSGAHNKAGSPRMGRHNRVILSQ